MDLNTVKDLHTSFCRAVGHDHTDERYYRQFERTWYEFHKAGYTSEELALVVEYVRRLNLQYSKGYKRRINPQSIVGTWDEEDKTQLNLERFSVDLQDAKREKALRDKQRDPRQSVLNEWRGGAPAPVEDKVIPIKDVLKRLANL